LAAVTRIDVTRSKNWVPGCPAEVVYRPELTKPDGRDTELQELRRQLRAARNITAAEQHHPADCRKCAAELVGAA
jgi:hypothetical protein